jgi:hypothetical protein
MSSIFREEKSHYKFLFFYQTWSQLQIGTSSRQANLILQPFKKGRRRTGTVILPEKKKSTAPAELMRAARRYGRRGYAAALACAAAVRRRRRHVEEQVIGASIARRPQPQQRRRSFTRNRRIRPTTSRGGPRMKNSKMAGLPARCSPEEQLPCRLPPCWRLGEGRKAAQRAPARPFAAGQPLASAAAQHVRLPPRQATRRGAAAPRR